MTGYFYTDYWAKAIKKPLWYQELLDWQASLPALEGEERWALLNELRDFFESALLSGEVFLGKSGPDMDAERKPIDTLVIHHTSMEPGLRSSRLNAVHMINIYIPYYANPTLAGEEHLKDKPLWSGHFMGGQQVFYGYHWLMRMDGSFEQLLENRHLGWQAGNWQINRKSVAICLDNDYENQNPTDEVISKLAQHIVKNYPHIKPEQVIGHCEAREGTVCPGDGFMNGWRQQLRKKVAALQ